MTGYLIRICHWILIDLRCQSWHVFLYPLTGGNVYLSVILNCFFGSRKKTERQCRTASIADRYFSYKKIFCYGIEKTVFTQKT